MHLYVLGQKFSTEVPEVILQDGCIPSIGNETPKLDSVVDRDFMDTNLHLEPAVWFKVQILDSLSIDCIRRMVLWNAATNIKPGGSSESDNSSNESDSLKRGLAPPPEAPDLRRLLRKKNKRLSESMYVGGECFGYHNDLEEIFDIAQQALTDYAENTITRQKFNEILFRLLHIYILPSICLSADDIPNVQTALIIQQGYLEDIDKMILEKNDRIEGVQRDMKKQRIRFVPELTEGTEPISYGLEFAKRLYSDFDNDVRASSDQLQDLQDSVEVIKKQIEVDAPDVESSSSSQEELACRREERDQFFSSHEALLGARERLHGYIQANDKSGTQAVKRGKSTKHGVVKSLKKKASTALRRQKSVQISNPLHDVYLGMDTVILDLITDIRALTDKKVLMISVKEALRGVLRELLQGEDTLGVDMDTTGKQKATDVLRHSRIPKEWLSLTEQVSNIVGKDAQKTNETWQQHMEFCHSVKDKCQAIIEEKKLYDLSQVVTRESNPPLLRSGPDGGSYVENKLYNMAHCSVESDRSSGISSCSQASQFSKPDVASSPCKGGGADHKKRTPEMANSSLTSSEEMLDGAQTDDAVSVESKGNTLIQLNRQIDSQTDVILLMDTDKDYVGQAIEKLRSQISEHFDNICRIIQTELGYESSEVHYKKIWQCYESHFYEETIPLLIQVYDAAYSSKCESLSEALPLFTVKDLDLAEIIFIHLLQDQDDHISLLDTEGISVTCGDTDTQMTEVQACCDRSCKQAPDSGYLASSPEDSNEHDLSKLMSNCCISLDLAIPEDINESSSSTKQLSNPGAVSHQRIDSNKDSGNPTLPCNLSEEINGVSPPYNGHSCIQTDTSCTANDKAMSRKKPPSVRRKEFKRNSAKPPECRADKPGEVARLHIDIPMTVVLGLTSPPLSPLCNRSNRPKSPGGCRDASPPAVPVSPPSYTTLVYQRRTWPSLDQDHVKKDNKEQDKLTEGNDALKSQKPEAIGLHPLDVNDVKPAKQKVVKMKPHFKDKFTDTFGYINSALKTTTPLLKLQYLTKCLREISHQVTQIQSELFGHLAVPSGSDDLIDMLVLLLCNCEPDITPQLYVHITMLSDLMAPFFSGGPFSFSLVQFSVAFQFLQDRLLLKKKRANETEA